MKKANTFIAFSTAVLLTGSVLADTSTPSFTTQPAQATSNGDVADKNMAKKGAGKKIIAAFEIGYAIGTALDKKFHLSDRLVGVNGY